MGLNLNPASIPAADNDFAPIPDGKYHAAVHEVVEEERTSSTGNLYEQARVQFALVGGKYANRRVFRNYIFAHPSEKAAAIGQQGLLQLWSAQGELTPSVTIEGLDNPTVVEITLKTKPGSNGYADRQEIVFVGRLKEGQAPADEPSSPPVAPSANPFA